VFSAGIPLVSEVAAFVPIFGIPAAVAYAIIRTQRRVGGGEPQTPGA
jgi:hypothetical protein